MKRKLEDNSFFGTSRMTMTDKKKKLHSSKNLVASFRWKAAIMALWFRKRRSSWPPMMMRTSRL
jgi:hypothetical protein